MTARDDWDAHWSNFGDVAAELNPANRMRERIILHLLGTLSEQATILDVGSGQGDLAIFMKTCFPKATVVGVEYSTEGVDRSRRRASERHLDVRFIEADLLVPIPDTAARIDANFAVCSEVLEHVDDPESLLHNVKAYLAPGCRLVVTVPGGPRSAFDRHIGHRRHFSPRRLRLVLENAGYHFVRAGRTGFPFFNLYRLLVIIRGKKLIADVSGSNSRGAQVILGAFDRLFRYTLPVGPFGWQVVGTAIVPKSS